MPGTEGRSLYSVMTDATGMRSIAEQVQPTPIAHLHIVTSELDLAGCEIELAVHEDRLTRLRGALQNYRASQPPIEYVIIDCPPSLGMLMTNALAAADSVLVPLQCEYLALEGLAKIINMIERIKEASGNSGLSIEGIVMTMYDARTNLSQEVVKSVKEAVGDKVFDTIIPRSIRLGEAPSHGKSIIDYDPSGAGAQSYRQLAKEFLRRQATI